MKWSRGRGGFTLVEVLVALAIVGTALGATLMLIRTAIDHETYLERRLFANWAADSIANAYRLQPVSVDQLEPGGEVVILGRTFSFTLKVSQATSAHTSSQFGGGHRVLVTVGDSESDTVALAERRFEMKSVSDRL